MDLNKLRTSVFEKTGIRIDTNDPVFALVALNETVLAESVERHVAAINDATDKLTIKINQFIDASERHKKSLPTGAASGIDVAQNSAGQIPLSSAKFRPVYRVASIAGIVLISILATLGMQSLYSRPPATTLTQEQMQMMQNGEKYTKLWPKLDTATQAKIQTLLQQ